jgi:uncharacterized protein
MQFQNLQVAWEELPRAESTPLKPIEKDYLKVLYISWTITFLLILAAVVTLVLLIDDINHWIWLPVSVAIILVAAITTFVIGTGSFRRKAYAVRERDILFQTGWIFRKLHIIPFNRVQHCVVQSGPIGRRYGLSSLGIYTAASNVNDIAIRGLKHEDAETLKAYILQQIQPLN